MGLKYIGKGPYAVWASDENYQAGANAWNGNPTKVVPTEGELAQGVTPGVQTDSRFINWGLNVATSHAGVIAHSLMRTWQPYLIKADGTDVDTYTIGGYQDSNAVVNSVTHLVVPFRVSIGGTVQLSKPILLAIRNLTTTEASILMSSDGSHWTEAIGSLAANADVAGTHTFDILADDFNDRDNVFLVSTHDRSFYRWPGALAGAPSEIALLAPAGHGFSCVGCDNVGTLLLGVSQTGSTTDRIFRSTDGGASFGLATTPAGWNTIVIHAFCATNPTQADLTAGDVVLATGAKDGEILRSTDQGITWTAVTLPTELASRGSWEAYQLAWSPVYQLFMCVNQDFDCAVSEDGLNWTVRPGSGGLAFNPALSDRGRLLSAVGPAFVLGANVIGGEGYNRHGVFYSFDAGFTWNFVDFGASEADNVQQVMSVCEWGGALAVSAPGKVWTSSSFWIPPADLDFA